MGLALGPRLHQPRDRRDGRVLRAGCGADDQPAAQVDRPGMNRGPRAGAERRRLPGQQADVELGLAVLDLGVDRHAVAGQDDEAVADGHVAQRHRHAAAGPEPRGGRRLHGQKIAGGAAGLGAQLVVQVAADQQQEQQRDRRVEIGMPPVDRGLVEADADRQQHADRDRHVHVGAALAQRGPGAPEEGHAGEEGAGRGDQGGQPVEQGADALAHLLVQQPGPDRHREHHRVGGAEPGDAECDGQAPALDVLAVERVGRIERDRGIAKLLQRLDDPRRCESPVAPDHRELPGGEVHPRLPHPRERADALLDLRQAPGAARALDQQVELAILARGSHEDDRVGRAARAPGDVGGQRHNNRRSAVRWSPRWLAAVTSTSQAPRGTSATAR